MRIWRAAATLAACGALALTAAGCSSDDDSFTGQWDAADDSGASLTLEEDGTLSGTDGCNRLTGSWEADGDEVTFGKMASTMKACPDMDLWLAQAASATISADDELLVSDSDDQRVGVLQRADE